MRIGISTSVIQRGKTGIAQHLFALLRAFASSADQHQFVLFVLKEDRPLFEFLRGRMQLVPVSETARPPLDNILWHQTVLPRLAREHRLDVLHVPSYRRLLWPRPCALVATIHDLAPFSVAAKYDPLRMFYGRVVAKTLARRQQEIIAISHNTARDIMAWFGISPGRINVIHNGIDHDRFFPGDRDEAQRWAMTRFGIDAPFFLYVSRLEHPGKNHVRLIEAFEQFKSVTRSNWKLVLAGSDWSGADAIHQAIQRSAHHRDIHATGFVSDQELPMLYRAAGVFVYPSLYEGFGIPPIEAMACGCPVISSSRGSLPEVVGTAAKLINPEHVTELRQEMIHLASDAALRERFAQAGITRARRFNWEQSAAATLNVYGRAALAHKNAHNVRRLQAPITQTPGRL